MSARALIAGGGPAGAAVAIGMAQARARPILIERARGPQDVVCGGFLGWDALASLRGLGVDAAALGARPIGRVRVVGRHRTVEAALPHAAAGLSRRTLDEALRDAAARAGAGVERGVAIRRLEDGTLHLADGATLRAETIVLATGKHELRGAARDHADPNAAAGLRIALPADAALTRALDGVIELHPFDGGYAGLLLQEDGTANLCLSVAPHRLRDGVAAFLRTIAGEAPRLVDRARDAGSGWAAIAGVPYGWRATGTPLPGLFRVGDQAAVIASLAGDGVAVALASAASAVRAWRRHGPAGAPEHQARFARDAARPLKVAGIARHLAESPQLRAPALALLGWLPLLPALASATRIGAAANRPALH